MTGLSRTRKIFAISFKSETNFKKFKNFEVIEKKDVRLSSLTMDYENYDVCEKIINDIDVVFTKDPNVWVEWIILMFFCLPLRSLYFADICIFSVLSCFIFHHIRLISDLFIFFISIFAHKKVNVWNNSCWRKPNEKQNACCSRGQSFGFGIVVRAPCLSSCSSNNIGCS